MSTIRHEVVMQPRAARSIPRTQQFYWTLRRELWDNRFLMIAPAIAAALAVGGFVIGLPHLPQRLQSAMALSGGAQQFAYEQPFTATALLMMLASMIVGAVYSIDCLYGERRDRSVLFWKSLPVSDLTTVAAKASVPLVVLPLLTFVLTFAAHTLMLALGVARLAGSGLSLSEHVPFATMSWTLLYHLVIGHGLWWAPLWGWLLLCSAWARRVPYLWAVLPLAFAMLVERVAFNSTRFAHWLLYRFAGAPGGHATGAGAEHASMTMSGMTPAFGNYLTSAGFWFGLALCAVFLYAAAQLRRMRAA